MSSIAIIGTGISAMGAAYLLGGKHDIVFYEKNHYYGGHTHTLTLREGEREIHVDTAFMVYNEITYPLLTQLFEELGVQTKNTDMSFSVQHKAAGLEYCGTGLNGLFAQRRNLWRVRHWRLLLEIDRFNKQARQILTDERYAAYSLKDYVKEKKYSRDFVEQFLIPISSAVWSTPPDLMLEFPAVTLVRFFNNHGFMGLHGHYQWKTVAGGARCYRDKIMKRFQDRIFLNTAAVKVRRTAGKVTVTDIRGERKTYDQVLLAAHADETLAVLEDATPQERTVLSKFAYQKNRVTLHTDASVMPQTRGAWSSWNYRVGPEGTSTVYWMNNLQGVSEQKDYFISVNAADELNDDKIVWDSEYSHPLFNVAAIQAQDALPLLNRGGPVFFCGAYFRYGFHEDGFTSGIQAARAMTGEPLWG